MKKCLVDQVKNLWKWKLYRNFEGKLTLWLDKQMVNMPLIPSNSPDCPTFTLSAGQTKALTLSLPNLTFTDPNATIVITRPRLPYILYGESIRFSVCVSVCVCICVCTSVCVCHTNTHINATKLTCTSKLPWILHSLSYTCYIMRTAIGPVGSSRTKC